MNTIQLKALFLNLIIYLITITPLILISLNKKIYSTKKSFFSGLIYCTFLEILISVVFYIFAENIFSIFSNTSGIINYAVYSSRILFISSSLFAIKILIPAYLYNQKQIKKVVILVISKITTTAILAIILFVIFSTKGILFAFPICDFIFYIIYLLNVIC